MFMIVRRLPLLVLLLAGISLAVFALAQKLPGDPAFIAAGGGEASPEMIEHARQRLGLDRPVWVRYLYYIRNALHGDFGRSIVTKQPVTEQFFQLFPATLELSLCAITFAILLGIPAGIIAAVKRGSVFDQTVMGAALVGYSMPIFWWGLLLIILFSGILQWTPVSGRISLMFFFPSVTGFMLVDSLLSGQAGAVRHGLSKALMNFEPDLRAALKRGGFLTRDSRVVERKKYGRAKARRSFQFSKR